MIENFEKKTINYIDNDRKSFYAYLNNRSWAKPSVVPLISDVNSQMRQMNWQRNLIVTSRLFSQLKMQ